MGKPDRTPKFLITLYVAALILRLIPVLAARQMPIGLDDMFQYDMLARSLAAGEGYRWYAEPDLALVERYLPFEAVAENYDPRGVLTSFRAPGYPFFLSLIYRIFGLEERFFIARIIQAFIAASLAPMTYLLARRLFPGKEKLARISGWLLVFYPYLIVYPLALATEVVFIPLVLGAVLVTLKAAESRDWRYFLLAGILFGAAALTRSVILGIIPFVLAWIWFSAKERRGAVLVFLCVAAFVIPWSVRNTRLHGQFTLVENAMGYTIYLGYHPDTKGKFQYPQSVDLLPYLDDGIRDRVGKEKALEFIQADPWVVPRYALSKLGYFFGLERKIITYFYSNNFIGYLPPVLLGLVFGLYMMPFAVIMPSAIFGVTGVSWGWKKPQLLIGLILLAYTGPHLVLLAEPRFHLAILPFLAVMAANAWVNGISDTPRWRIIVAVVLVILLVGSWAFGFIQDADKLMILFGPEGNQAYFSY
jgi:4-amino-4-deoxy-L-arabinose transferase-like glycosyltransferase